MAGTFPSTPGPALVTLQNIQPSRQSDAHSLRQSVRSVGAQRWGFKLSFKARRRTDVAPLIAFLISQHGRAEIFQFVPPGFDALGAATGSPVSGPTAQTGNNVATNGWTASAVVLRAGDFVKFQSHSKVYMAVADVTSDASGNATLQIEPSLMQAVTADPLTVRNVPFSVGLAADNLDVAWSPPLNGDLDIVLVERF